MPSSRKSAVSFVVQSLHPVRLCDPMDCFAVHLNALQPLKIILCVTINVGLPGWLGGKERLAVQETRVPGEGNGNPLQCSCLANPSNRGAWTATVHGVAKRGLIC